MRIHLLSDLHLRYSEFSVPDVEADITVLAGDINRGTLGVEWANEAFTDRPALYVLGNHEFYRGHIPSVQAACKQIAQSSSGQLHILEKNDYVVGNRAFLGTTLWTDFLLFGAQQKTAAMEKAAEQAPDFHIIETTGDQAEVRVLEPADTCAFFVRDFTWLQKRLAYHQQKGRKTCVITHYAPSLGSLATRFKNDPVSAYFVSNLDEWIKQYGPDIWIHGHTHDRLDYHVGNTRILCNARGYPNEQEDPVPPPFDPSLVIDF